MNIEEMASDPGVYSEDLEPAPDTRSRNPQQVARDLERDEKIAELEAQIAQREDQLKQMISSPSAGTNSSFTEQDGFRTIAKELPGMQAELKALKAEQTQP